MSDFIDNTPAAIQRAEWEADQKAKENPMTGVRKAAPEFLHHFAKGFAKRVLTNAEKVGKDTTPMKKRMAEWVNIVQRFEKDIAEVMANKDIPMDDRLMLVGDMRSARNSLRVKMFEEKLEV